MKDLLFLSHRIPFPPDKGEKIRAFHIFNYLADRYRIHLGTLIDDPADWPPATAILDRCTSHHIARISPVSAKFRSLGGLVTGRPLSFAYFGDPGLRRWVRKTMDAVRPSIVFAYSSSMTQYLDWRRADSRFVAVDLVDVDSEKFVAYQGPARGPMRYAFTREARLVRQAERHIAASADLCTVVTNEEAQLFSDRVAHGDDRRPVVVGNGVDTEFFAPNLSFDSPLAGAVAPIVFVGRMDYKPNIDAVSWFLREILPLVRAKCPDASLWIVGSAPTAGVRRLDDGDVTHVTGRVPDVRPYLAHARVVIAPMQVARGIQNKVLEAMAMAKPVVLTNAAATGLGLTSGQEVLIADTVNDFTQAIDRLLHDGDGGMGKRARACTVTRFSWSASLAALGEHLPASPEDVTVR